MMIRKSSGGNQALILQDLDEMKQFSNLLAQNLGAGDIVALRGDLGAGKTTFCQFLCAAMSVTEPVTSPTFTLFNEYWSKAGTIVHGDFYRLTDSEIENLLPEWEERIERGDSLFLLEWADRAPQWSGYWTVQLDFGFANGDSSARVVEIQANNPALLSALSSAGHPLR